MELNNTYESELVRVRIVLVVMLAALVFLGGVLWRIQVLHAATYEKQWRHQSIRRLALPGTRGRIFDRNGVCMADNRPSFNLALHVQELRQSGKTSNTVNRVEQVLDGLAGILGEKRQISRAQIEMHIHKRLAMPLVAWTDLSQNAFAKWEESEFAMQGNRKYISAVEVQVEPVRVYPQGKMAAHLLGYVGDVKPQQDEDNPYHFYIPEMKGKCGIEDSMNDVLAGIYGWRLIQVDASGFRHEAEKKEDARPGYDITLALDCGIQALAERVLEGEKGVVVVMDPRNGDVLAMASSPSFDSNSFSPKISVAEWARLNSNPDRPLLNRAISGAYPPGSIFKPVVAIAALENKRATGGTTFNCPGYYRLGSVYFRCWKKSGHGRIVMQKAIEQSCNSYFCQLGLQCGYERVYHMATAMGVGSLTRIELSAERSGLMPNNAWKVRRFKDKWRSGDTCNVSIGQGALLVTPLQMATIVSTIANGGYLYRPRLVKMQHARGWINRGELAKDMNWSAETLRVVRSGMRDVVESASGTGKRAQVAGIEMGGKTGTAQYGPEGLGKKHTWMLFFAPFKRPRYAGVILIEDGLSGGITVAPRVKTLMEGVIALERPKGDRS